MVLAHAPPVNSPLFWPIIGCYTVLFTFSAGLLFLFGLSENNPMIIVLGLATEILVVYMVYAAYRARKNYYGEQSSKEEESSNGVPDDADIEVPGDPDGQGDEKGFTPVEVIEDDEEII